MMRSISFIKPNYCLLDKAHNGLFASLISDNLDISLTNTVLSVT